MRSCSCGAIREGTTIEEDHMRNRQMIVHWLMAHTKAIERPRARRQDLLRDGGCGRRSAKAAAGCWPRCSAIKSEGDYAAAQATLFERYGIHFDPALRDEIVARVDALNLPSYTGFVQPRLEPVIDHAGQITDVEISLSAETWSGRCSSTRASSVAAGDGAGEAPRPLVPCSAASQSVPRSSPGVDLSAVRVADRAVRIHVRLSRDRRSRHRRASGRRTTPTAAMDHVGSSASSGDLPGNAGYDASLDRMAERLEDVGCLWRNDLEAEYGNRATTSEVFFEQTGPVRAWDHTVGTLALVRAGQPDDVVLSREKERLALCINSFSTAPGGVVAPLVDVGRGDRDEDYAGKRSEGRRRARRRRCRPTVAPRGRHARRHRRHVRRAARVSQRRRAGRQGRRRATSGTSCSGAAFRTTRRARASGSRRRRARWRGCERR